MDALTQVALGAGADLDGFRAACRALIGQGVAPDRVVFEGRQNDLFGTPPAPTGAPLMLPKAATDLIGCVVRHSDPERYGLLYALVWRLTHGERALLDISSDPLVHRLERLAKSVRRDIHKMHAFVRFRRVDAGDGSDTGEGSREGRAPERFIAWFEPEHWIVEAAAPFFVDRFRGVAWAILTPKGSVRWDGQRLESLEPSERPLFLGQDDFEAHWLDYYESIFNPARLNTDAMRAQMSMKYWKNLPEAASISRLVREAPARVTTMIDRGGQAPVKRNPDKAVAAMADQAPRSLDALNRQIAESAPPAPFSPVAVLGEGPMSPAIAIVGEQPGDQEDLARRPFVGPAGQLLNAALDAAGLDRSAIYVTNAVKHFKFKQAGKRRIHQTPTAGEIKHYRWWLELELEFVRPRLVVALGATATQALAGKALPVLKNRGPTTAFGQWPGLITVHPSSLLRETDPAARARSYEVFVSDLQHAGTLAASGPRASQGPRPRSGG